MNRISILAAAVIGVLVSTAPGYAQNRVEQQMFLDLRALQEQSQQLKLELNTLIDQLKAVNSRLDAEASARNKGFADQQVLITGISSALSTVQENVRDNKVQVQKFTQELDAIKKGLDILTTLVTQAMAQVPAATSDPTAPARPPSGAPAAGGGVPASSQDYFMSAMSDYGAGQYDMAIKGFDEVIRRFPASPDAAKAQFYIGESYSFLNRYNDAISAYDKVIKNYKDFDKEVADALYKQGVAYENTSQRDKAVANYKLLQKNYAGQNAEMLASQRLKTLNVK
jgi:TolA-binding protein